jgi:steroid delta-isomerase-like uncharacterized protein
MSTAENKAAIRRYVEELNRRNLAVLDEVIAPEVSLGSLLRGQSTLEKVSRERYKEQIIERITAFPDYKVKIEEMIAEDDQVVLYWTNRRTHTAEFLGVPPTGKEIVEAAISIYRLAGGRIVEVRGFWDRADTWQQLGLIPADDQIIPVNKD